MYRYTPKKSILKAITSKRTPGTKWWDEEYHARASIIRSFKLGDCYKMQEVLQVHYPKVCYYSGIKEKVIFVHGYLFPVSMFNVEEI